MTRSARHRLPCTDPDVVGTDAAAHARQLAETFDAVLGSGPVRRAPRPVVSASWERSLAARVDPDRRTPPVVHALDELREIRAAHPLGAVITYADAAGPHQPVLARHERVHVAQFLVLGPLMEENLRRALLISRGDATVFFTRPLSASLMAISAFLLILAVLPALRRKRDEVFVESES